MYFTVFFVILHFTSVASFAKDINLYSDLKKENAEIKSENEKIRKQNEAIAEEMARMNSVYSGEPLSYYKYQPFRTKPYEYNEIMDEEESDCCGGGCKTTVTQKIYTDEGKMLEKKNWVKKDEKPKSSCNCNKKKLVKKKKKPLPIVKLKPKPVKKEKENVKVIIKKYYVYRDTVTTCCNSDCSGNCNGGNYNEKSINYAKPDNNEIICE